MPKLSCSIATALALSLAQGASAITLTFDAAQGDGGFFGDFSENGFDVSPTDGSGFFSYFGTLHVETGPGPFPRSYDLTAISGQSFSVASLDILNLGDGLIVYSDPPGGTYSQRNYYWNDVIFEGYSGGVLVATQQTNSATDMLGFALSSAFTNLDVFRITTTFIEPTLGPNEEYFQGQDLHYLVDNINIAMAPVPLPASSLLLTSGLLGLVGFRQVAARRRRSV